MPFLNFLANTVLWKTPVHGCLFCGRIRGWDENGAGVNEAPVEPQSRARPRPAGRADPTLSAITRPWNHWVPGFFCLLPFNLPFTDLKPGISAGFFACLTDCISRSILSAFSLRIRSGTCPQLSGVDAAAAWPSVSDLRFGPPPFSMDCAEILCRRSCARVPGGPMEAAIFLKRICSVNGTICPDLPSANGRMIRSRQPEKPYFPSVFAGFADHGAELHSK